MGRKRRGKGKHLLVPAACLMLLAAAACAPVPAPQAQIVRMECNHLKRVDGLVSEGDFDAALRQSQDVLSRFPRSAPGADALMNLGLLHAHYANPRKDYRKALAYFLRLEREFPQSPLAEEARIWAGVLQSFEQAKQVDLEIEQMKKGMAK